MDLKIRLAKKDDAEELINIYAPYVENTAVSFECAVPTAAEFEERIENTLQKYPYLVAELNGELVGYTYAGPFKSRSAYNWSVETSIYVKEDHRGTGIGKELYDALERYLSLQNIVNMYAAVAYVEEEDEYLTHRSVIFHQHVGFETVAIFEKCASKFGRWYDLMWMKKRIGDVKNEPIDIIDFSKITKK